MPTFPKVSHISFSSRDADRSAAWYQDVLGLEPLDTVSGEGWRSVLVLHSPSAAIIEFQQHEANQGEAFDPRRTGIDHMGLKVDSRADLDEWRDHLVRLRVRHSPIADREYGSVLCFRDPDEIQLEMFYREGHP